MVSGEEEEEKPDSIFTPKTTVPTRGHFCIIILQLAIDSMVECYWLILVCTICCGEEGQVETVSSSLVLRLTILTPGISAWKSHYFHFKHVNNFRDYQDIDLKGSICKCTLKVIS